MQFISNIFKANPTPPEQIEPIAYEKILHNPPKWVEDMRAQREEMVFSEEQDIITRTDKIALFVISGLFIFGGAALLATAVFASLPTVGMIFICGLGLAFSLIGAAGFETTYKKQTIENG